MSNKLVKVILANDLVFPLTVAEAVLVNKGLVITLDKLLDRKIESINTPEDSGLSSTKENTSVTITHTNKVTPNNTPEAQLILYDLNGHIIKTEPAKKLTIIVNNEVYNLYDGNTDSNILFGDDFKMIDNNISLTWGGIIK